MGDLTVPTACGLFAKAEAASLAGTTMADTDPSPREIPILALATRTLIFDNKTSQQILWIDGVVVLPIGATVELTKPNLPATVVGVRLLAGLPGGPPAMVCLDVNVPDAWWNDK